MPGTDTAAIENSLRALGAQADASGDPGSFEMPDETAEPSPAPAKAPSPKPPEEAEDQPPAPAEKDSPTESAEAVADDKPLSKYQKAQQRQADAWKKIEADKAQLKAEREALEKERSTVREPMRDERKYTADDYRKAAEDADANGETEIAQQLRQEEQKVRMAEHKRDWWAAFKEEAGEHKLFDALKDPAANTPEVKQFTEILNAHNGILRTHPMGAKIAVRLLNAERNAATASALKTENERLIKENERLTKATSLPRTGPSRVGSESTTPKELSENDLRRMADEHDQSMVA